MDIVDRLRDYDSREHSDNVRCEAAAEIERQAAEIASLRLTLGGRTYSADVPEPIGCPAPGACVQVAEIERLRAAHAENARLLTLVVHDLRGRIDASKLFAIEMCANRAALALAGGDGAR
jgi:hypothetical protein